MMTEIRSPLTTSSAGGTLYDKLKSLSEEINEGILNLSSDSKSKLQEELEGLRETAIKDKTPEVMLNILLFRKYADIANNWKDVQHAIKNDKLNLIGELPSFVYETNDDELVGWNALRTNVFWLRLIACIFAFISYVVMATVPAINYAEFNPGNTFSNCRYDVTSGHFNFRPYQAIIAFGVVIYVYNALFAIYYILPVDDKKQKFIPGMAKVLGKCFDQAYADQITHRTTVCCSSFSKFVEMVLDTCLLLGATVTCVIGSITLERSVRFTYTLVSNSGLLSLTTYFTVGSFYRTFDIANPPCLQEDSDPAPKIRGALGMMYMAIFVLGLTALVSIRSFRKDLQRRTPHSMIKTKDGEAAEEVVEFRRLPVVTDDEETV